MNHYNEPDFLRIISEYKTKRKANPDRHIEHVKSLKRFTDIIVASALAIDEHGEKHINQEMMNNARLRKFAKKLLTHEKELNVAKSFDEIYNIISTVRVFELGG